MNAKQERKGGSPPIPGVVEVDGAPPTKNFITRLAEGIINGRAPTSVVPFSELIPELRKIEDGGGDLREYIEELEERAGIENHNNGRILSVIEKIRSLACHDNQVIVDGHPVGGRTTAIVTAVGALAVGAGVYLRLEHAPFKPRPRKEESRSAETPNSNHESKVQE